MGAAAIARQTRRLLRLSGPRRFGNFVQLAGLHIVDVPVDGDVTGHQRVTADAYDVLDDAPGVVRDRHPVDVLAFRRAWPRLRVAPAALIQARGLETFGEEAAHDLIREQLHAAVRMMDHEPFGRAEQLVGNDQRPDGVIARPAAGVANDVGIAFGQPGVFCRVKSCVHTGEDREMTGRREREFALGSKTCGVLPVCPQDFIGDRAHLLALLSAPRSWFGAGSGRDAARDATYRPAMREKCIKKHTTMQETIAGYEAKAQTANGSAGQGWINTQHPYLRNRRADPAGVLRYLSGEFSTGPLTARVANPAGMYIAMRSSGRVSS